MAGPIVGKMNVAIGMAVAPQPVDYAVCHKRGRPDLIVFAREK
jgi:hypothetical protein